MWIVSTFLLILCNASKSAKGSDFIFLFDWFKRNADWRVQTNSCCQRAKVHRLETQPGSAKCYVLAMLQLIFFQSAFIFRHLTVYGIFIFFSTYFKVSFTVTPTLTHEKTVFSVARLECLKGFPIVDRHQVSLYFLRHF